MKIRIMGSEYIDPCILDLRIIGDERSSSRLDRFTPWEIAPGIHWIGGWVCPRTGLDDAEKKESCPYWDSNSDPSAV
jgi:hypothetical protein